MVIGIIVWGGFVDLNGDFWCGDEIYYVDGMNVIGFMYCCVILFMGNVVLVGEVILGIYRNFVRIESK